MLLVRVGYFGEAKIKTLLMRWNMRKLLESSLDGIGRHMWTESQCTFLQYL